MSQKGDTEANPTGSISEDVVMPPNKGKRCRDQNEEDMHLTTSGMANQCVKARDLDLSGDILPSVGHENGTDNHISTVSEKRLKCGPSIMGCDAQSLPCMLAANANQVATSGFEGAAQLYCEICNVKSTSLRDSETHLSGKKHAKRMELAAITATSAGSSITKGSGGCSKALVSPSQKIQALIEDGSAHSNANMAIISMGQQVLVDALNDNAGQAFKSHLSSCAGGTDSEVVDCLASLSKCPDLNDANAVGVGQQASIDGPLMEPAVNYVSKNDSSNRAASNDGPVTNGTVHNPTFNDAKTVAVEHQVSIDGPGMELEFNQVSKNDFSIRAALDDGPVANGTVHDPTPADDDFPKESSKRAALDNGLITNETVHDPTLADDFPKESSKRVIFEDWPTKSLLASLTPKSNSDCVTRALASALSAYTCPGLEDLQKGNCCSRAAVCSDSQTAGAMSADSNSMVSMHAHCFLNLLHDVRISVIEDLFRRVMGEGRTGGLTELTKPPGAAPISALNCLHDVQLSAVEDLIRHVSGEERNGGLTSKTWLPSAASTSAVSPDGETAGLNCSVCRVEYGSKADLDLHLAGKRHTSLVRRMGSRCQLCNVNCNSERELEIHLSGRKHASRLRLIQKRVTF